MPAWRRIGPSATTVCMVVQFGLATIPLWSCSASGLTSETTSGTSSSMRHCDELSTTTAPASAKRGAHSALTPEPAENSAISKPWIDSSFSDCTVSLASPQSMLRPAERSEANGTTSSAGNERSRSTSSIVDPTAPVAPTTATRIGLCHLRTVHARHVLGQHGVGAELERGVQLPDGLLHVLLAHDTGDLDRRGGDHLDVHAGVAQHGEGLGRHTRMALHSGADDRDLPHPIVGLDRPEAELGRELGQGDPRLRGRVGHGCDERSFHGLLLVLDHRTGSVVKA